MHSLKNKIGIWISMLMMVCSTAEVVAQQTPFFSQYYLNRYLVNPAYAGEDGYTNAFFGYRKQWVSVPGAPETQVFSLEGTLKNENIGMGVVLFNDVTNILGRLNALTTVSYGFKLADDQRLNFGLSMGFIQNRVYFDRIFSQDPGGDDDPALLDEVDSRSALDGNFGIRYSFRKFHVGLAAHQLFENTITHDNIPKFKTLNFTLIRHYLLTLAYSYPINDNFTVDPGIIVRTAQGLTSQIDFLSVLKYKDKLWLSTAYRNNIGVDLGFGAEVNQKFAFSYSYEIPVTTIRQFSAGSHEVSLNFRFGKGSPSEIDGRASVANIEKKIKRIERKSQQRDIEIRELNKKTDRNLEIIDSDRIELKKLKQYFEQFKDEIRELEKESIDVGYDADLDTANWNYYVVFGTFKEITTAKRYQKMLMRNDNLRSIVIRDARGTVYMVTSPKISSKRQAAEIIKNAENGAIGQYLNKKPWVYKKRNDGF